MLERATPQSGSNHQEFGLNLSKAIYMTQMTESNKALKNPGIATTVNAKNSY